MNGLKRFLTMSHCKRRRVHVGLTVRRAFVGLFDQSTAATAAGGFAAACPAGRRCRLIAAGVMPQAPALSSKCG